MCVGCHHLPKSLSYLNALGSFRCRLPATQIIEGIINNILILNIKPLDGPPRCAFPSVLRQCALQFCRSGCKPFHL
ncbi:hypothetical protein A6J64_001300 [Yersinia enterocolitica]|nr:hypothetical protein A6J64_001300 [Yersinia enterocolitica]PNM18707.1 hypothetical protein A6J65_007335 [Yersinia enterocolitica]RLZ01791.1 hypothetical protein COO51_00125 [Yersinia enterocolitica]